MFRQSESEKETILSKNQNTGKQNVQSTNPERLGRPLPSIPLKKTPSPSTTLGRPLPSIPLQNPRNKKDFFSNLSPDILLHIFSFLPRDRFVFQILTSVEKSWKMMLDPDYFASHALPYVLSAADFALSQNEYLCELKKFDWTYTDIGNGKIFDNDINRSLLVNGQALRSHEVERYAEKFPLIKQYRLLHSQMVTYLFNNVIAVNFDKAELVIMKKNYSANIRITENKAQCIADCNLLLATDLSVPVGESKLFLIPGRIQTIFEMTSGQKKGLKLKVIKTSNRILRDLIFNQFTRLNHEMLDDMIQKARAEEPTNALYNWYIEQAKIFLGDTFYRDYSHIDCDAYVKNYLLEVKHFLESCKNPKLKYSEFMQQVRLYFQNRKVKSKEKMSEDAISEGLANISRTETTGFLKKHSLFLTMYALLTHSEKANTIPLPLPTVGLDDADNLYIIFPAEAFKFKTLLMEYNRRVFNEVFNKKDEEGNCMALFTCSSELVNFLIEFKMDLQSARTLAIALHEELSRDPLRQELQEVKLSWEHAMHQLALALNLDLPSKEASHQAFQKSTEYKALLEKRWGYEAEKNKSDVRISEPLSANGIFKMPTLEVLKIRLKRDYQCVSHSIGLDQAGLRILLTQAIPKKLQDELKKFDSMTYSNDENGFQIKMTDFDDIRLFVTQLSLNFEVMIAEAKLVKSPEGCCLM